MGLGWGCGALLGLWGEAGVRAQRSGRGHCSCGAGSADPGCSALQRAAWLVPGDFPNTLPAQWVIPAPELPAGFQNLKGFFCISSSQHPRLAGAGAGAGKFPVVLGPHRKCLESRKTRQLPRAQSGSPEDEAISAKRGLREGRPQGWMGTNTSSSPRC